MSALRFRRALLPLAVFSGVLAAHVAYRTLFPDAAPGQARWATVPTASRSWLELYIRTQACFLGLSYASAAAFAATSFRRYRERQLRSDRNLALGGITVSGFLAVAGCYLLGCCGSPMLGVYLSLLGPWFLPWTGPLTLALTLLSLAAAWYWMKRKERRAAATGATCCRDGAACGTAAQAKPQRRAPHSSHHIA